jgi:hypothetical protein
MRPAPLVAVILAVAAVAACAAPTLALARPPRGVVMRPATNVVCKVAGLVSGLLGTVCKVGSHPKAIIRAGKKLLSGDPGGAVTSVIGSGGAKAATAAVGLAAVVAWVSGGARAALQETAKLVDESSRPNLQTTWFSSAYWRVAAVSALLTLPFLFAAAAQSLLRSDLTLLARATFGYLPLGMLAVGVAAPVTMLLLSASDEMSAVVASASGNAGTTFLGHVSVLAAASNPFVAFLVAMLTVAGSIVLWLELLVREAAVYVIVLMLPLFFAALVWPARRVWATRAVELLVALILSKFVIVAVLALGGAALEHAAAFSITSLLAGLALVLLAAFSPWALLRMLPLHEMASAAATGLRHAPIHRLDTARADGHALADATVDVVGALPSRLREMTRQSPGRGVSEPPRLPASQTAGPAEPVPSERIEAAAEEAATAVAASGGTGMSPAAASGPAPPVVTSTDAAGRADAPLSAPGADSLPDLWHQPWPPIQLSSETDFDRPIGGRSSAGDRSTAADGDPPAAADVEPPTLPDREPPLAPVEPPAQDAR